MGNMMLDDDSNISMSCFWATECSSPHLNSCKFMSICAAFTSFGSPAVFVHLTTGTERTWILFLAMQQVSATVARMQGVIYNSCGRANSTGAGCTCIRHLLVIVRVLRKGVGATVEYLILGIWEVDSG